MAGITAIVTAITKMVRGIMEEVPLDEIMGQPTLKSVQHLVKYLAAFASHFATIKLGDKHGFLPIVLTKTKMRLTAGNKNLNCKRIKKPDFLNAKIEDDTKGCNLLQFEEDHKIN